MSKNSLLNDIKKLKLACDQQDWNALKLLDQKINADIRVLLSNVKHEEDRVRVMTYLQSVEKVYQLVVEDSVKHRDEISKELKKITQDNKVANLYLESSQYLG